jgi:hypothetical protein
MLHREDKNAKQDVEGVVTAVDVVAQEEKAVLKRVADARENPEQIVQMAVEVANDDDRRRHVDDSLAMRHEEAGGCVEDVADDGRAEFGERNTAADQGDCVETR